MISGESGAGKSESTKHVLKYIAHASEKGGDGAHQDGDAAEEADLNDQIIATSEVLEAFGNAKTTRNHNRSAVLPAGKRGGSDCWTGQNGCAKKGGG